MKARKWPLLGIVLGIVLLFGIFRAVEHTMQSKIWKPDCATWLVEFVINDTSIAWRSRRLQEMTDR